MHLVAHSPNSSAKKRHVFESSRLGQTNVFVSTLDTLQTPLLVLCLCMFVQTPHRRGAQIRSKWCLNLVLGSHKDLSGDQNDMQYLSI